MRTSHVFSLAISFGIFASALAQEAPILRATASASGVELVWPGSARMPDGTISRPYFELERSDNLEHWTPVGERLRSAEESQELKLQLGPAEPLAFYRLHAFTPRVSKLASGGPEVFGYANAFADELQKIGQISVPEFQEMFDSGAKYLPGIGWDPTTAAYWDAINAKGFKLDDRELALFKTNGFVVSERLGASPQYSLYDSFADIFYSIWHSDLPVFVSTDAILQAWHRTYDAMLEETEETYLVDALQQLLDGMAARIEEVAADLNGDSLKESVRDVDFFLTIARSLITGGVVPAVLGPDARVSETLADITKQQLKEQADFFGQCRVVDYSQFLIRGHYTHSERLGRYFKAMMWLGRIDFPIAGGPFQRCPDVPPSFATPREAGGAIVLWDLLQRSGQFNHWLEMDRVIQTFSGLSDSLGFSQLGGVLAGAEIRSVRDVPDLAAIEKFQKALLAGEFGVQNIRSDYFVSPFGPEQVQLPRAFLVFGQRFAPDSWALAQTVFDSILWTEKGSTGKVNRRVPSGLDVAFSVLGNDQVVPQLAARMSNSGAKQSPLHAVQWRDGLPYQHNLAAVRNVIDAQNSSAWESSIYLGWLGTLRELSEPTTDGRYPEAMRTRAWAMKTLNTQLASWTQLRHDTVLYIKQSYTSTFACSYQGGYVEPRSSFWKALSATADRAATSIEGLSNSGSYTQQLTYHEVVGTNVLVHNVTNLFPFSTIRSNEATHLRRFAATMTKLAQLSDKELRQECFDSRDNLFIRNLIQNSGTLPFGCGGIPKFDGWYPQLFYHGVQFNLPTPMLTAETNFQENYGAGAADRLVVDVHTDLAAPGDPGSVLHEATGRVNLLMIAVDAGPDRAVFLGPVLSHFEFEIVGDPLRLTDLDWDFKFSRGVLPVDANRVQGLTQPEWTQGYLVPQQ